ncbi:MAG TPA: phosphodiester glycosidase family protein [Novosphingobium sp.]|nr:phosphodiester glycosidase family protein [Novosphingobium sp.]
MRALIGLFLLAGCAADSEPAPARRVASACATVSFEGDGFTHCLAVPGVHTVRTQLDAPDGDPARSLEVLADIVPDPKQVAFAMNGGMYDENGEPIGYYVEDGERRHTLNRVAGGGNFGLLPNGVFWVDAAKDGKGGGWHVRSADVFADTVKRRPAFATQSGPMLVIAGKLHPRIAANGESLHVRNAVGIDAKGRAHFVISDSAISFGRLARFMRDRLKCPNALYLDGSVSALWDPAAGRLDRTVPLGPLIVVEKTPRR